MEVLLLYFTVFKYTAFQSFLDKAILQAWYWSLLQNTIQQECLTTVQSLDNVLTMGISDQ